MKNNLSTNEIPKNKFWVNNIITAAFVIIAMIIGVIAGPMLTYFLENSVIVQNQASLSEHDHDHISEDGWYVCPMHPSVVQQGEGTCPICFMNLTPLDPDRFTGEIVIDPTVVQNTGIRIQPAVEMPISSYIETVGIVEINEEEVFDVTLKYEGWLENVNVQAEQEFVKAGDELLEVYSPKIYKSSNDYLLLHQHSDSENYATLKKAARNRLRLLDFDDKAIEELEKRNLVSRTLAIRSPANGYVIENNAVNGQKASKGALLFRIADLSKLWVIASVYENQLPDLSVGDEVTIDATHQSSVTLNGSIQHIYPTVDEVTRQAKVRIAINNPDGKLKPGMHVNVDIKHHGTDKKFIQLPSEAVIRSGERSVAFVSLGDGRFEPREITTGIQTQHGMLQVISGIKADEQVVVSGQFLLDSESRLREALTKMIKDNSAVQQKPVIEARVASTSDQLSESTHAVLSQLLDDYLVVFDQLYMNEFNKASIKKLTDSASLFIQALTKESTLEKEEKEISDSIAKLRTAGDLKAARIATAFLSHSLIGLLEKTGLPETWKSNLMGVQCGMFPDTPSRGVWLQKPGDIRNPYYGKGNPMESCHVAKWGFPEKQESVVEKPKPEKDAVKKQTPVGSLKTFTESYLAAAESLYNDDIASTKTYAESMKKQNSFKEIEIHLETMISSNDLVALRVAFGEISVFLDKKFKADGVPSDIAIPLVTKHCGMYPDAPENGMWIQKAGETRNPFFGKSHIMAACAPKEWALPKKK